MCFYVNEPSLCGITSSVRDFKIVRKTIGLLKSSRIKLFTIAGHIYAFFHASLQEYQAIHQKLPNSRLTAAAVWQVGGKKTRKKKQVLFEPLNRTLSAGAGGVKNDSFEKPVWSLSIHYL